MKSNLQQQIKILRATQIDYPYVVATGNECLSSRGLIIVFSTLANAIGARDTMNRIEAGYGNKIRPRWEVKRLEARLLGHRYVVFEDLINKRQVQTFRDYSKSDLKWRTWRNT